jgi:hypothetical protein
VHGPSLLCARLEAALAAALELWDAVELALGAGDQTVP